MPISRVFDPYDNYLENLATADDGVDEDSPQSFISSEFCMVCEGDGIEYIKTRSGSYLKEQCQSCLECHEAEIMADKLHDEMKGA